MTKRALMVIASQDFRDEEYFSTKEVLEKEGIKITTASDKKGIAVGVFGGEAKVDVLLEEADIDDFDAVIFVGGSGARSLSNEMTYEMIRKIDKDKILAAICIAPTILAEAGVLKGKRCTAWSSNMDKSAIKIIEKNGGRYEDKDIVIDGNLITANGPEASHEFGLVIARALTEGDK